MERGEGIKKLAELMKDVRICMLTTHDSEGQLHSRPMAMQQVEFDGDLWFFTGRSTDKAGEIKHNQNVNVSFAEPEDSKYISISGTAELVQDRAKAKQLWNPLYQAWFPKGLEDPDLTLLKVNVQRAEFWNSPGGVVTHVFGYVKAMATGTRATDIGEHEKLDISH